MPAISPELNNRLHEVLARCPQFDSAAQLHSVFVDERISPWRDAIPEAGSRSERIAALIAVLHDRANTQGQSALVLFLQALADTYPPGDALHQELRTLARSVETDVGTRKVEHRAVKLGIPAVILLVILIALALGYPRWFRTPAAIPTSPACPGKGTTDEEKVLDLIEQERHAVLAEDIDAITSIFAPEVIIQDVRNELTWASAATHYTEMFHNKDHCSITHTAYTFKPEGEGIEVTCLSSGKWGAEGKPCTDPYENDLNTWRFRKDEAGCWRIVEFTYNNPPK